MVCTSPKPSLSMFKGLWENDLNRNWMLVGLLLWSPLFCIDPLNNFVNFCLPVLCYYYFFDWRSDDDLFFFKGTNATTESISHFESLLSNVFFPLYDPGEGAWNPWCQTLALHYHLFLTLWLWMFVSVVIMYFYCMNDRAVVLYAHSLEVERTRWFRSFGDWL